MTVRFGSVQFVLGLVVYGRLMFYLLGLGDWGLGIGKRSVSLWLWLWLLVLPHVCGRVGAQQQQQQQWYVASDIFSSFSFRVA